jgi:hypothetical protein
MATELRFSTATGFTLYVCVRDDTGKVWYVGGEEFETWGTGSRTAADYAISLTEQGGGGYYTGDFDTNIAAGTYDAQVFQQDGANPADTDRAIGLIESLRWTGVSVAAEEPAEVGAVDICNRGFLMLAGGPDNQVILSSYDEDTKNGQYCRLLYPQIRNEVLAEWDWSEAGTYADLGDALTGGSVPEMAEWEYAFSLPSDCLVFLRQTDEGDHTARYKCAVKKNVLFTNDLTNDDLDSAYIYYVAKVTDVSEYAPMLIEAIATKLASELAPIVAGDHKLAQALRKKYSEVLESAIDANQKEVYAEEDGDDSWLNAYT